MKEKYKDACDNCGKFDYCKGYENKVLCPKCIEEVSKNEKQDTNT